jgi:hypothetical protein
MYFKKIIILVPQSWDMSDYTLDHNDIHLNEGFSGADIIVDRMNRAYGDQPYVKLSGMCGVSGDYIHLTKEFLLDPLITQYDPGKSLSVYHLMNYHNQILIETHTGFYVLIF